VGPIIKKTTVNIGEREDSGLSPPFHFHFGREDVSQEK
jgi:hypothetical protein